MKEPKQSDRINPSNLPTVSCVRTATCIAMDATVPGSTCRQRIIRRVAQNFSSATAAPVSKFRARWPRDRPTAVGGRHPAAVPPRCAALHRHGVGALSRRRDGTRGRIQQIAASAATWDEQTPPEGVIAAIEAEDSAAGKITFVQAVSNTLNIMVRDMCTACASLLQCAAHAGHALANRQRAYDAFADACF